MTRKTVSRHALVTCTFQLHNWKPFLRPFNNNNDRPITESDPPSQTKQKPNSNGFLHLQTKRQCISDRATPTSTAAASSAANLMELLDVSKMNLLEDDNNKRIVVQQRREGSFRWIARKRRRRGSRSVSGRSSDKSRTRNRDRRCCSDPPTTIAAASAACATCSDFPVAGTDSSGELFLHGDVNWASDVSEVKNNPSGKRDGKEVGRGENFCNWQGIDAHSNESGYGSEPGYRGDGEFGYGDEFDEEEDDGRLLFWGDSDDSCSRFTAMEDDCRPQIEGAERMEIVGENVFSEQKIHHRCRRKKHDSRMIDPPLRTGALYVQRGLTTD